MHASSKVLAPAVAVALAVTAAAQQPERVTWDYKSVPITVEVARDVPVKRCGFERGVLCAQAEFTIHQGERFQMLEIGLEGGCTIEYQGSRYDPSSCPWLLGFADHQADVFVIVEVPGNNG